MALNAFVSVQSYQDIMMLRIVSLFALAVLLALPPAGANAADDTIKTTIKDHVFTPSEIKVSANKRVMITVINEDATAEEFDSPALKVEKVVAGKSRGVVRIGPLRPGRYPFVGEYHESTAKGEVIAE
jgi:plastocyanin